jgi:hypothetical protein
MNTIPNDVARCEGVGYDEDGTWGWREGCETCLRRTAPRNGVNSFIEPPKIVAFECEFLIEPERNPLVYKGYRTIFNFIAEIALQFASILYFSCVAARHQLPTI